jgi:eukaryotic-like serine/threonine-protein kinase
MRVCPTCRNRFPPGSSYCPYDGHSLEDLQEESAPHDEFLGMVLDTRYRIESRLGKGGMGVVYAARHVVIDKPVAVKILRREYSSDPHQVERFMREARAASRIGHPNIIDVTDFGTLPNGQIYFIMEFLVGETLSRELRNQGALLPRRLLDLSTQICHALSAAHAKGIVHRDLKPENIFIVNPITAASPEAAGRRPDLIKLLDFGIAKITWDNDGRRLTRVGSIFGTPQYMSPEQAAGKDADHRGDIYALGCIIYEMLTGEVPFTADTFMGTLTKHMFERPVPPRQLRPDLRIAVPVEAVILKAMEKNPDERYQSMTEMGAALDGCARAIESESAIAVPVKATGPLPAATPEVVVVPGPQSATVVEEKLETVHLLVSPRPTPAPTDAIAPLTRPPKKSARTWRFVIGAAGLLIAAAAVVLVVRASGHNDPTVGSSKASVSVDLGAGRRHDGSSRGAPASADAAGAARTDGGAARWVKLVVQTVPSGALVLVNGERVGRTPYEHRVLAGRPCRMVLRKPTFEELSVSCTETSDQTYKLALVSKRRKAPNRSDAGPGPGLKLRTKELRLPCELSPGGCKKKP